MKVQLSPKSSLECSRIIVGCMKWGVWGADLSTAQQEKYIEECIALGATTFDHADIYGHYTTEAGFGKALANRSSLRSQMQIITKCGINLTTPNRPQFKIKSYTTTKEHIIWSTENSLEQLQTDYIDLMLIHRPSPLMHPDEMAAALTELKDAGKVLNIGVSNFTTSQFDMLNSRIPLITNQVEASILHLDPMTDGTFDQCLQHQISPMAWSPLAGGQVFTRENDRTLRIRKVALELREKYGASGIDQILLAFLLKHPANILPIVGTAKMERIATAVAATQIDLSEEDWFQLLEASVGEEVA